VILALKRGDACVLPPVCASALIGHASRASERCAAV
jgi:hypothetical protein